MNRYWLTTTGHIWTEADEAFAPTVAEFPADFVRRDLHGDSEGYPDSITGADGAEIAWAALTEREQQHLHERAEQAQQDAADDVAWMAAERAVEREG